MKQEQINIRKKYKRLSDNLYMLSFVVGEKSCNSLNSPQGVSVVT